MHYNRIASFAATIAFALLLLFAIFWMALAASALFGTVLAIGAIACAYFAQGADVDVMCHLELRERAQFDHVAAEQLQAFEAAAEKRRAAHLWFRDFQRASIVLSIASVICSFFGV